MLLACVKVSWYFNIYVIYRIGWILFSCLLQRIYILFQEICTVVGVKHIRRNTLPCTRENKVYFVCIQWYHKCSANYF